MAVSATPFRNPISSPRPVSGLGRFFQWWGRELAALVPPGLRPMPRAVEHFIWVDAGQDRLSLWQVVSGKRHDLNHIDLAALDAPARKLAFEAALGKLRRRPVALSVPNDRVLRKTITLPLSAKDNLRQVVGFELNRHTPFQASQACFDCQALGEDSRKGKLDVLLTVTPVAAVDVGLRLLQEWGRPPQALVAEEDIIKGGRYANLLPAEQRPRSGFPAWLRYLIMASITAGLLAGALGVPLWQKQEVLDALEEQLGLDKRKAETIDELRKQLDHASGDYQYLLEKKYGRASTVQLIEEVTRLLPDDTWLTQLGVKADGEVILLGETNSSAGLIRLFERSSLLEEAGFRAPLVKASGRVERFQLGAKIRPISPAEAQSKQKAGAEQAGKGSSARTRTPGSVPNAGPGGRP